MSNTYKVSLCMRFDTCKRCPKNKRCEAEYIRQEKKHNDTEGENTKEHGVIKNVCDK